MERDVASFTALNGWTADGWRSCKQGGLVYQFAYDPQGSVVERQTDGSFSAGFAAYDQSTFEGFGALRQSNKVSNGGRVGQPTRRASEASTGTTRTRRRVLCA